MAVISIGMAVRVGLSNIDWLIILDLYNVNMVFRAGLGLPAGLLGLYRIHTRTRTAREHKLVGAILAVWSA